ncbi:MAG: hypothetical protein IJL66_02350 [Lachnospiraceae bacterium]|nr:hypothetical protein [Lachnospiraceae bacterium]
MLMLLLLTACGGRTPVPSTEFDPHIPAHDEPSLETLLSEEPYASLFPAAVAETFEMQSSVRMLYDPAIDPNPYGWNGDVHLNTAWAARGGAFGAEVGTMDISVEMQPKHGEHTVEASA